MPFPPLNVPPPPATPPGPPPQPEAVRSPEPAEIATFEDLVARGVHVVSAFHAAHPQAYAARVANFEARAASGRLTPPVKR